MIKSNLLQYQDIRIYCEKIKSNCFKIQTFKKSL